MHPGAGHPEGSHTACSRLARSIGWVMVAGGWWLGWCGCAVAHRCQVQDFATLALLGSSDATRAHQRPGRCLCTPCGYKFRKRNCARSALVARQTAAAVGGLPAPGEQDGYGLCELIVPAARRGARPGEALSAPSKPWKGVCCELLRSYSFGVVGLLA